MQNASKNVEQINSIVNLRVNDDYIGSQVIIHIDQLRSSLKKYGIVYYKPYFLEGINYLFVSQTAFSRGEILPFAVTKASNALSMDYPDNFNPEVFTFIFKELVGRSTRGTRFYDLSIYNKSHDRLAVIIFDKYTLDRNWWPNAQNYNDALTFMLIHEMAHSLAGVDGSPVYDFIKKNVTDDKDKLDFYKEGFADLLTIAILTRSLPKKRADKLLDDMIEFRATTLTSHTHDTSKLLTHYKAHQLTEKEGIARTLLSH